MYNEYPTLTEVPPSSPWHVSCRSNVVPSFKLDSDEAIDLRGMPPAVAEVYVLTGALGVQSLNCAAAACRWWACGRHPEV